MLASPRRLNAACCVLGGLILLCGVGVLSFRQAQQVKAERVGLRHMLDVLGRLNDVGLALRDAESGQRGFILTGEADYLAPYRSALARLPELRQTLHRLIGNDAAQRRHEASLDPLIDQKLAELEQTVRLRRGADEDAARRVVMRNVGRVLMVRITATLDDMLAEQQRLLTRHRGVLDRGQAVMARLNLAIALIGLLLLAVTGFMLRRSMVELRDSEAAFRLLAEHAGDVVARIGPDGRIRYISPSAQRILGLAPEAFIGQTVIGFVHPEDRAAVSASTTRLLDGIVEEEAIAFRIRRPDGREVWLETIRRLLRDPATGARDGFSVISRDVTERRQHQAELERRARDLASSNEQLERLTQHLAKARDRADQASQSKSRFLASMSHELRTPLNAILGYAQLLRLQGHLDRLQSSRVDAMLGAGRHLLEMINRVLDLSEIEAARVELQVGTVDLREVSDACLSVVRCAAGAKGLALRVQAAADAPGSITADPTRLRQILLNLLGNAVKFTHQGEIELRLCAIRPGMLRIEVHDTGPGVPAETRHLLFQDFRRLDAAFQPVEGTGLGLAISVRLAALMGGQIGHDDRHGGGSVFWLELPVMAAAYRPRSPVSSSPVPSSAVPSSPMPPAASAASRWAASAEASPAEPVAPASRRRLRLLLVDDIAMNRDIASSFLDVAGHQVTCAENGAEAVAAAASGDYDVVLMDVRMPGMDGLEAARRIRAGGGARGRVPIVALTAQAFAEQIEECRMAGMDSHLAKPFTQDALIEAIDRVAGAPPAPGLAAGAAGCGSHLPICNAVAFDEVAAILPSNAILTYLRTLSVRGATLLDELRGQICVPARQAGVAERVATIEAGSRFPRPEILAKQAHNLAGSAGMLGFQRLAFVASRFEQAVEQASADGPGLGESLDALIEESLLEMQRRMRLHEAG